MIPAINILPVGEFYVSQARLNLVLICCVLSKRPSECVLSNQNNVKPNNQNQRCTQYFKHCLSSTGWLPVPWPVGPERGGALSFAMMSWSHDPETLTLRVEVPFLRSGMSALLGLLALPSRGLLGVPDVLDLRG